MDINIVENTLYCAHDEKSIGTDQIITAEVPTGCFWIYSEFKPHASSEIRITNNN